MAQQVKKYTVITGASSGIGFETAKAFAERGKKPDDYRPQENPELEALKRDIQSQYPALDVVVKAADLSEPENAYQLYAELKPYTLETWVNNAGFGSYGSVAQQDLRNMEAMLRLDIEALTILSTLFVHDYRDAEGAQLINVSSAGGYTIVPNAVTYCAAKFYVSAFTEGLARELEATGAKLRAKVLAPAATKTEFGKIANHTERYDYDRMFANYHTSRQAAEFLMQLYDSEHTVGLVDRETFRFSLGGPRFPYAEDSRHNQRQLAER